VAAFGGFHPVLELPSPCPVFDFSGERDFPQMDREVRGHSHGIGRYDEHRPGIYTSQLYEVADPGDRRTVHMGVDLFAPAGTAVHAFWEGEIFLYGNNSAHLDYGYTIVTRHVLDGIELYALHGHLAGRSLAGKSAGQPIRRGEAIAWLGERQENGGWHPHLHFQLSYEKPLKPDLPGVVSLRDRELARLKYPDPRLVLGPIY
jgi:murein DD-endopeptidase MepM/ murein hydrolase activator NlpD